MKSEADYVARLLRQTAATVLLPRWPGIRGQRKADGSLMTAADLAAQDYLAEALARDFPNIPLLSEEMSGAEQSALLQETEGLLWVLDPLDGTTNYAAGFPVFAISLALIERDQVVLGVVLDPVRDECFTAVRGQGALLNGQAIRACAAASRLENCVAVVDLKRLPEAQILRLSRQRCFGSQRNLGAVALEWCWLGAGRFHLYLHGGQRLWDYAAGRLIAEESGAVARQLALDRLTPRQGVSLEPCLAVAAANTALLQDWQRCLGLDA